MADENYCPESTGIRVPSKKGGSYFKDFPEIQEQILNDRRPVVRVFEDMDVFWDYLEQPIPNTRKRDRSVAARYPNCYKEAMKLAREGWPEGRELIKNTMAKIDMKLGINVVEPVITYDVVGDEVDVGAYLGGQPENMLAWQDAETTKKMVRIVVNTTWHGSHNAAIKKGAIACTVADIVDRYGWRSEIIAASGVNASVSWELYLTVKKFSEPLNIDRIAYMIGSPEWDRFQIFRAEEQENEPIGPKLWQGSGYGGAAQVSAHGRGDIYINAVDSYGDGERDVIKHLNQLGVKFTKEDTKWGK